MTTPACTSFAGVATNRFLLGAFEAVVNPGFILIIGKKNLTNLVRPKLMPS